MKSLASNRQAADAGVDFSMPDFLDLAGEAAGARFSCSSSSADGGVLVFDDHVVLVSGISSERVDFSNVTAWEIAVDGTVWIVTVRTASEARSARIHPAFAAPAISALEAEFGPAATS